MIPATARDRADPGSDREISDCYEWEYFSSGLLCRGSLTENNARMAAFSRRAPQMRVLLLFFPETKAEH